MLWTLTLWRSFVCFLHRHMCYKWFKGVLCECVNSELCDENFFVPLVENTGDSYYFTNCQNFRNVTLLFFIKKKKEQQKLIKQIHVSVFFFLNALN